MGTTSSIAFLAVAAVGLLTSPATADDLRIALSVSANPASDVKRIFLGIGGGSIDLVASATGSPTTANVVSDNSRNETRLAVEWMGGKAQSIPFFSILPSPTTNRWRLYLRKKRQTLQTMRIEVFVDQNCNGRQPGSMEVAFAIIADCSPVAIYMASKSLTESARTTYLRALNGWFVANYFLYSGLGYSFHPSGFRVTLLTNSRHSPKLATRAEKSGQLSLLMWLRP